MSGCWWGEEWTLFESGGFYFDRYLLTGGKFVLRKRFGTLGNLTNTLFYEALDSRFFCFDAGADGCSHGVWGE